MAITHDDLWTVALRLPQDYEPYGAAERAGCDCSCGCRFYAPLAGAHGYDWGVCSNPASHRAGLLTFEHQGCAKFEPPPDVEADPEA